jgi:GDPmannose 4,6-dehydratase
VGLSFEQPVETMESISLATLNLLEATRFTRRPIKFYNASSGECFGETGTRQADESTPFRPRSPYGVAKAAAHWEVVNYREAYQLFACNGILFNHESPLRPARFVTRKIVSAACRIAAGSTERLQLGNIEIQRDWGWAPEYVEAMWLMLQQRHPDDYVVATGRTDPLREFVKEAFQAVGLDWGSHVTIDRSLYRPSDISVNRASAAKAAESLQWKARMRMPEIVRAMVKAELDSKSAPGA